MNIRKSRKGSRKTSRKGSRKTSIKKTKRSRKSKGIDQRTLVKIAEKLSPSISYNKRYNR